MSSIEGLVLIAIGFAAGVAVSTVVFHFARKRSISYLFSKRREG